MEKYLFFIMLLLYFGCAALILSCRPDERNPICNNPLCGSHSYNEVEEFNKSPIYILKGPRGELLAEVNGRVDAMGEAMVFYDYHTGEKIYINARQNWTHTKK